MTKFNIFVMPLAALAIGALPAAAQTTPKITSAGIEKPTSAIFIGNSFFYYNNGITSHLSRLLQSADPDYKLRLTMITISGSGADWHDVDSYFRPNGVGKYSFDPNNNIVFNKIDRLFDLAIMMDCSQCPLHPQLKPVFKEFGGKQAESVRKHGAVPVFFMSWAYADKPEMTAELAEAYTQAGNANDAFVIPAGLAFDRVVRNNPEINLYVEDKRHPPLAGTYLAACTVYASLFKKSPIGLKYTAGLNEASARTLQAAAWDTVQDYFGLAISSK